jgi:hypothetical protein
MKKILIVTLVLLMAVTSLHAQQAGQFSLGGRLGLGVGLNDPLNFESYARQAFYPDLASISHTPCMQFNIALYGNYAFSNMLSIQTELNFMLYQGYDLSLSCFDSARSREAEVSYNSLDIPLLIKVNFLNDPSRFGILAGPHVSIPLGRAEFYREIGFFEREDKFRIDTFATYGLTAGIFGGHQVGPGRIVGDLRFIFDFSAVETIEAGTAYKFMERRALTISLGYEMSF